MSLGFDPSKVRDIHKPVINEIFKNGQIAKEVPVNKASIPLTSISEVKVGDSAVVKAPELVEDKKPYKPFKPKPKFVNDKKKTV